MAIQSEDIKLDTHSRSLLEQLAKENGASVSDILGTALEEYAKKKTRRREYDSKLTCYDIAQQAGIIGMVEDAPSDLSYNPQYLDGFGRD